MSKIVSITDWRKRKQPATNQEMERQIEQLVKIVDELQARVIELEIRQLQLVRALTELLSRMEE